MHAKTTDKIFFIRFTSFLPAMVEFAIKRVSYIFLLQLIDWDRITSFPEISHYVDRRRQNKSSDHGNKRYHPFFQG